MLTFVPSPGFSIAEDACLADGGIVVISRSDGKTFAPRAFGASSMLFDLVSRQYSNGVNLAAYSGFKDGTPIPHTVWETQSSDHSYNTPPDVMVYSTSRPMRTLHDAALYSTLNMQSGKGLLGEPLWPAVWGPQANRTLYLQWYARSLFGYQQPGGGDGTCKFFRLLETTGENIAASGIQQVMTPYNRDTGQWGGFSGFANQWVKHELWLDVANGIWEHWFNGAFHQGSYSALGGTFEFAPPTEVLYASNKPPNTSFSPQTYGFNLETLTAGMIGFDDGHGLSAGNCIDIAPGIYADPNWQRPEISPSAKWDTSPTSTMLREIQGNWTLLSPTQIQFQLNLGQFATLGGLYAHNPLPDRKSSEVMGQWITS